MAGSPEPGSAVAAAGWASILGQDIEVRAARRRAKERLETSSPGARPNVDMLEVGAAE
jgi:hypothetical protein